MKPQIPDLREIRRWGVVALGALAAMLVTFPAWGGQAEMRLIVEFCYYLALAQAWNLLAGYSGLVSVGQQAFVGLGSYTLIAATVFAGSSPLVALPLAGLLCAAVALPSAFLMFRLQGAYFAIGTWALAEVFRVLFTQIKVFGAGTGMTLPISVIREIAPDRTIRETIIYYTGLALGIGTTLLVFLLMRSRYGLALTAIRDSQSAAASVGVDAQRLKLGVYVLAAGIAGLVGALIILQKLRITPAAGFSVLDWSANVIFIVVIGGIGTIEGPIIGALVFFTLRFFLADYGTWYLIVLGSVAIAVMLKAPRGIWGYLSDRYDLQLFPVQRRVRMPEAQAGAAATGGGVTGLEARARQMVARLARTRIHGRRMLRLTRARLADLRVREIVLFALDRLKSASEAAQQSIAPSIRSARAVWARCRVEGEAYIAVAIRASRMIRSWTSTLVHEAAQRVRSAIPSQRDLSMRRGRDKTDDTSSG